MSKVAEKKYGKLKFWFVTYKSLFRFSKLQIRTNTLFSWCHDHSVCNQSCKISSPWTRASGPRLQKIIFSQRTKFRLDLNFEIIDHINEEFCSKNKQLQHGCPSELNLWESNHQWIRACARHFENGVLDVHGTHYKHNLLRDHSCFCFHLQKHAYFADGPALSQALDELFIWNTLHNFKKQGKSEGFDSCDRPSNIKLDSNRQLFHPCDREIWWMTKKNNRALLLYYVKLCASFQIHWWIQTGFTVQKRPIPVGIGDILSCVTLKFDGWPWLTIGHLFYVTSTFVHHFLAIGIGELKLELQSRNT